MNRTTGRKAAHVFATDFPTRFFFVEPFRSLIAFEADNNVALDGTKRADFWCASGARHRSNGDIERCGRRGGTIICELAVIQITFEEDKVRA